jgi:transposase-like protein
MRGRHPAGPEVVDGLDGSLLAKHRFKVVLQVVAGRLSVQEACRELDICPQRFHQLREQALTAAVVALEPGQPGRRPRQPSPAELQVGELQEQLAAKDVELHAAQVREEIILTMPRLGHDPSAEKKTTRRPPRPPTRGRPPGKKTFS